MKRTIISLITVAMLIMMTLPATPVSAAVHETLEGWTLGASPHWTTGAVKGWAEGECIPFRYTVANTGDDPVSLNLTLRFDHKHADGTIGIVGFENFVIPAGNITGPTLDGSGFYYWDVTIPPDIEYVLEWCARLSNEAGLWSGAKMHVSADGKDVPIQVSSIRMPDLYATKSANVTCDAISYTISYGNNGEADQTNTVLVDDYDENQVTVTDDGGGTDDGDTITWNIGDLAAGATGSQTFAVSMKAGVADGAEIVNAGNITGYLAEDNYTDNTYSLTSYATVGAKADFHASDTDPCANVEIDFFDDSTGTYDEWFWDFGDGTNSTLQNPSHTYVAVGNYTVSLTISSSCGDDTKTRNDYIKVLPLPEADFHASNNITCVDTEIDFFDDSTGTYDEWFWDFGDGNDSTAENPSHTYTTAGNYTVSLTISNGCGDDTETKIDYITVLPLPEADFHASNNITCVDTEIDFFDDSTGTYDEWFWDFGDGTNSTAENPSHTYTTPGNYTVSLTISNGCGDDTETKIDYITVLPLPEADFHASNNITCVDTEIDFFDDSTGTYDEWFWDFGDGSNSTLENPSHTYTIAGNYTVSLTISNGCGDDTETKIDYITVLPLPEADFHASNNITCVDTEIDFFDDSTGTYDEWFWDFGDGSNSTDQNPSHTYTIAGTYTVSLTISNGCGDDTETKIEYIIVNPSPTATFSGSPTSGCSPLTVAFTDASTGNPTSWSWTFGDGGTSTEQSPSHTYTTPGTYTVSLTVSNGCGEDTETKTAYITAEDCTPPPPTVAGGGGCPTNKYLTCDWEGNNTTEPLYSNNKLAVDLLGPSPDGIHNLFLESGTHAPVVDETTYYLIVVRELEDIPPLPEGLTAIVVFNITPADAVFNRDIFLTLGIDELPQDALNVTMAYYDDIDGVWETLEFEAGGPNGVAELTLSAPINHFSIYGVLAELEPTAPPQPAHFVPSGLTITPGVEKTVFVTRTGETVTITANIANDGGQEGTYDVALKLNGQTVDTKTVTIAAGQSKQVSFTESGLDYGQYDVEVAGLTGEFTASRAIAWWLILLIIVVIGLIIWGVVWARRRRKAQQEA